VSISVGEGVKPYSADVGKKAAMVVTALEVVRPQATVLMCGGQ